MRKIRSGDFLMPSSMPFLSKNTNYFLCMKSRLLFLSWALSLVSRSYHSPGACVHLVSQLVGIGRGEALIPVPNVYEKPSGPGPAPDPRGPGPFQMRLDGNRGAAHREV